MTQFIRRPLVKASCFALSVVLTIITILGISGFAFCSTQSFYMTGNHDFADSSLAQMTISASDYTVGEMFINGGEQKLRQVYNPRNTNLRIRVTDEDGNVFTNFDPDEETPSGMTAQYYYYLTDNDTGEQVAEILYSSPRSIDWTGFDLRMFTSHTLVIEMGVSSPLEAHDVLYFAAQLYNYLFQIRYPLIFISIAGVILTVFCHAAMFVGCGRKVGSEEVFPGWQERIPFDLYLLIFGFIWCLLLGLALEMYDLVAGYSTGDILFCTFIELLAIIGLTLVTEMILCSCAVRFKTRKWWKNSLIWKFCAWFFRLLGRFFTGTFQGAGQIFGSLPLTWQGVAVVAGMLLGEFLLTLLMVADGESFITVMLWILYNVVALTATVIAVAQMRRLQDAAGRMAKGDLDYQANTEGMTGPFKEHAENLNAIRDGLSHALDQKMKSERMKTELITNVSHDIKTPLTSIVNYVDLLSKEKPENPRMLEYIEALKRQSSRLRKLIEDLVEASKASTGNLSVDLQPCELGVLLEQAAGEYQERMEQKGLELVTSAPEEPVMVLADSRRIWRVLDNLLGNICKYALTGTRVYVDLEKGEEATLTLRNISRDRLKVSPDELMERFVRGDTSRSTEGSGLGLSIAKSLMEWQHGKLELSIDGDLFKATVRMPLMQEAPQQAAEPAKEETPPAGEPSIGYTPTQPSALAMQPQNYPPTDQPMYSTNTNTPWRSPGRPASRRRSSQEDPVTRIGKAAGRFQRILQTGKKK